VSVTPLLKLKSNGTKITISPSSVETGVSRGNSLQAWLCPGSTVVEHSTHNPKIKGSSPAIATGTRRNKIVEKLTIGKYRDRPGNPH